MASTRRSCWRCSGRNSTYGKYGRAARNRSWGNIRGGTTYPLDDKRFRIYPSWTVGAADCARLLGVYGRNAIRSGVKTDTVQTFPFVWAPSSDGNAPDRYGDQLAGWITAWQAKYPASGSGAGIPTATLTSTSTVSTTSKMVPFGRVFREIFKTRAGYVVDEPLLGSWAQFIVETYPELKSYTGLPPLDDFLSGGSDPRAFNTDVKARLLAAGRPYIGQTIETVPAEISIELPAQKEADPIAALVAGLGEIARNGILLVAIVVLVLLGLYMLATGSVGEAVAGEARRVRKLTR